MRSFVRAVALLAVLVVAVVCVLLMQNGHSRVPMTWACGGTHTIHPDGHLECTGGLPRPSPTP